MPDIFSKTEGKEANVNSPATKLGSFSAAAEKDTKWGGGRCQAKKVQVSMVAEMEVVMGQQVPILCPYTMMEEQDYLLMDKYGGQQRVAYNENGKVGVDRGTEYTDRVHMDSNNSLVIPSIDVSDEKLFFCQIAMCTGKNGYPAPTIHWYKDGQFLNITTEHNKELYEVVRTVKEASGLYSRSSMLYMRPKKADKNSIFQCKVSYKMPNGKVGMEESEPFNLTLHFIKEGDDGPDDLLDLPTTTDGILLLPQVTKADSGTYRCQVLDFYSPSEVELEKDVSIFIHLKVNRSEDLQLNCSGSGSNLPTLSWKKGRQQMGSGKTLSLQGLTYPMAGTYICEASVPSISGLKRNESVQVIVEGKPEVDIQQTIIQDHEQTVAYTPGLFRPSSSARDQMEHTWWGEVTPKLIQSGVQCTAENKYGSTKKNFELKMGCGNDA
ncbi:hypothetical protein E2320_000941 [Naja naja]|nr:hypothetical protein E2320_000941 [Naja naja]